MQKQSLGFTLVELMTVVVILAMFAAIAIPSYQSYTRRVAASQVEQEMLRISNLLERHKARSFSYQNFATTTATSPANATGSAIKYNIEIFDADDTDSMLTDANASGRNWVMRALSTDNKNFSYLLTSTGMRCKNKTLANISFENCGTVGSESW